MTGILIDPHGGADVLDVKDELDTYYDLLDCHTIDIVSRKIGGKYYDIICDDEGLFKDDVAVSAIDKSGEAMLVGKLFICKHDGNGNQVGLTQEDIERILPCVEQRTFLKGVCY